MRRCLERSRAGGQVEGSGSGPFFLHSGLYVSWSGSTVGFLKLLFLLSQYYVSKSIHVFM